MTLQQAIGLKSKRARISAPHLTYEAWVPTAALTSPHQGPGSAVEVPRSRPALATRLCGLRDTGHAGICNLHAPLAGSSGSPRLPTVAE